MSILSLPNELLCYIVEEFLPKPADVFALLRGSNRRLAPVLTNLLNSYAIRREHALEATLWAAFHQHRDFLSLLIKEGAGIRICHPPHLPLNVAHSGLLDYAMENSRSLRVRDCDYDDCTMLQWAVSSPPHVRLERVEKIVSSGVRYGEEVFSRIEWGSWGYLSDEDLRDQLNSATLDLLLRYLPVGELNEILEGLSRISLFPILEATQVGHRRVVELLLQNGVPPDACEGFSCFTALHLAAKSGHIAIARILLEYGADIRFCDAEGKTPLHYAISTKQSEMVQFLAAGGAALDEPDQMGNTPLSLASESGDPTIVGMLISYGADVNRGGFESSYFYPCWLPIHIAAKRGHSSVVEVLVRLGADIEAVSTEGTPLVIAAGRGHDGVVRLLIEKGANMYPMNDFGVTLIHMAAEAGHEKTVAVLAERMAEWCINSRDFWGNTPMHRAAWNGHIAVVKTLFRFGADVNVVREDGVSPLFLAVSFGSSDTVSTLLDLGAQVQPLDSRAASESTPLHEALKNRCLAIVRLLLEHIVDVNLLDVHRNTPLHLAIEHHHSCDTIRELLLKGADPNVWNSQGSTPFHLAAASTQARVLIPVLVEESRVIDLNYRDLSGRTVLDIVSEDPALGRELSELLISRGASNRFGDYSGMGMND